jgi:UDP-N-acetyl-D-glucosamine dehydrogenase
MRRQTGRRFGVLEQAQDVNDRMPNYVASRVAEILNSQGRAVKEARILVLGVAYKPDVGDVRESPALRTMQVLHKRGADVRFHDFFVNEVGLNGGVARCVANLDEEMVAADVVLLLTPHAAYDLESIADRSRVVFDTRNAYGPERRENVIRL